MGRGRAKGKKLSVANNHDEAGSGEEEKIPAQKRRGRPHKPLRDDIDEDEVAKIEEDELENKHNNNHNKNKTAAKDSSVVIAAATITAGGENGKRRKRNVQAKEKPSATRPSDDNGVVVAAARSTVPATTTTGSADESIKTTNGFRHIGSRRKNKPRRAAEVGVECK